jgi:hypothetical protein
MNIREFRTGVMKMSQKRFCEWLNLRLVQHRFELSISKSALHAYEIGNRAPPLHLAIAVEDVTESCDIRSWPYLAKRFATKTKAGRVGLLTRIERKR